LLSRHCFILCDKLDFGQSSGMTESVNQALLESGRQFRRVMRAPGHDETALAPNFSTHGSQGVAEGGTGLVIPALGRHRETGLAPEPSHQ
jgi:hypothetical protein